MLLKSVTSADAGDRIAKEKLNPALRFLWDSYRNCLELLRNNAQLESKYHEIARAAYKFCVEYKRRAEFRKLCDTLRTHLNTIQKQHHSYLNGLVLGCFIVQDCDFT
jgi:translation initiation factor 3 subunit A